MNPNYPINYFIKQPNLGLDKSVIYASPKSYTMLFHLTQEENLKISPQSSQTVKSNNIQYSFLFLHFLRNQTEKPPKCFRKKKIKKKYCSLLHPATINSTYDSTKFKFLSLREIMEANNANY